MGPEWEPVTILGATGSDPPLPGAQKPISSPQLWGLLSSFIYLHQQQSNGQGEGRSRDSSSVISSDIERTVTNHCPCSFQKRVLFINTELGIFSPFPACSGGAVLYLCATH